MYYGGFTYSEARNLPANERAWFRNQIKKELEAANGKDNKDDEPLSDTEKEMLRNRMASQNPAVAAAQDKKGISESRARHHNTPEIRALQGKDRTSLPSRLMRFQGS